MTLDVLRGSRILVVEDDVILAFGYEDMLKDVGAEVIGPAVTVEQAERLAATNRISAALLDIRLGDDEVWPVARLLASKGVPFAFCTAHFDRATLPAEWLERRVLTKPARPKQILGALADLVSLNKIEQ
jgi:DNA-binding response OmpR family regulator